MLSHPTPLTQPNPSLHLSHHPFSLQYSQFCVAVQRLQQRGPPPKHTTSVGHSSSEEHFAVTHPAPSSHSYPSLHFAHHPFSLQDSQFCVAVQGVQQRGPPPKHTTSVGHSSSVVHFGVTHPAPSSHTYPSLHFAQKPFSLQDSQFC